MKKKLNSNDFSLTDLAVPELDRLLDMDADAVGEKYNLPVSTDLVVARQQELDLLSSLEEIINSKDLVPHDLKFDDRELPEAPNYYSWCTQDQYLGSDMPPYLEQALIGIKLFGEYCPKCSDLEWMADHGHKPQDGLAMLQQKVALFEHGICPHCGYDRVDAMRDDQVYFFNELAVNAGQRSGKSALVAMLCSYQTHRILKMQKPTKVYNVKSNTIFHGTFVALTFAQAKETLWDPYFTYIAQESPWFQDYHNLMLQYQEQYGREIVKVKDTYLLYKHRALMVYPSGPDKRSLRGRTRIFGAIDEIGWFDSAKDSSKVKTNAHEVYAAMNNSLRTVRNSERRQVNLGYSKALTGYMYNISSPSSHRDKICELVRQSIGSKKILGLHKPTWEMNPDVTREDLDEEYRKDPIVAARDFGAEPPLSSNPFIGSISTVENTVKEAGRNFIKYRYQLYTDSRGDKFRYATISQIKKTQQPSLLAIDAGLSNNSFSLACVSLAKREIDGQTLRVPSVDVLVEINPLPGIKLHFSKIFEHIIVPMCEARNVKVLLADRWNSVKILQDAESTGVVEYADQYSLKYQDMWSIKTRAEQHELLIPRPTQVRSVEEVLSMDLSDYPRCFEHKATEHLLLQLLTVQDTGKSIIKGEDLTDDLWRAAALGVHGISDPKYVDLFREVTEGPREKQLIGVMKSNAHSGRLSNGTVSARSSNGSMLGVVSARK